MPGPYSLQGEKVVPMRNKQLSVAQIAIVLKETGQGMALAELIWKVGSGADVLLLKEGVLGFGK